MSHDQALQVVMSVALLALFLAIIPRSRSRRRRS